MPSVWVLELPGQCPVVLPRVASTQGKEAVHLGQPPLVREQAC